MTTTWWAVLAATLGCFAFKIAGHSVPQSVLDRPLVELLKDDLQKIRPMKAVFDKNYVRNLDGKHVKTGATKMDLAEQLMEREDARCALACRVITNVDARAY